MLVLRAALRSSWSLLRFVWRGAALSALLVLGVSACAQDASRAKLPAERIIDEVAHFEVIELHGPLHADIVVGRGPSVVLEGPEELLERLQVTMGNDRLILRLDHDGDDDDDFVTARIQTPALHTLDVAGAGRISLKDPAGEALRVTTSGASQLIIEGIALKTLRLTVAGASESSLSGRASEAHFSMSGAGSIRAQNLVTEVAHVDLSGAGSVRLHATERVEGSVAGVGKVTVAGDPKERAIATSGIGDVLYE